ncbi:hypothetical protein [Sphingobium sp.]|uniref:hypothetical protein n=1 Tax=Sphingobium sp. TaxID=1912891 RepID=UPI003BB599F5
MSLHAYQSGDNFHFAFWLTFSKAGDVRLTRRAPALDRDERAVSMTAVLPLALWATPSLSAQLVVQADAAPTINIEIATAALRSALGIDIDLRVTPAEEPQ